MPRGRATVTKKEERANKVLKRQIEKILKDTISKELNLVLKNIDKTIDRVVDECVGA